MPKTIQNSNYIINKNVSNSVNISPLYTNDIKDSNLQEINIGNYTNDIEIGDDAGFINIGGPDTVVKINGQTPSSIPVPIPNSYLEQLTASNLVSRSALTAGTPNTVVYNNNIGVLSDIAQLFNSLGGTGIDSSAATGIAHIVGGVWSASSIINSDITDGTIANNKLSTATTSNMANYIIIRDSSGNIIGNNLVLGLLNTTTLASTSLGNIV